MAETRFIKTVTFGGYDKNDVDKRLESLYSQVYELKNELREAKLSLEKYKEGTDEEKTHESVLAVERAKLTQLQVKNENITERLKAAEDDNKNKEKENEELKESVKQLKASLDDANSELSALKAGGDAAALGVVFIEAQKSRDMLLSTAKTEAAALEADSKKLSENMITEANNKAASIIYEAEKQAAEITANAENKSEQMKVASGNLRASMLSDVGRIGEAVTKLKEMLAEFEKTGFGMVDESEKLLKSVEKELTAGGVPVFSVPKEIKPELPEEPEYQKVDNTYGEAAKKKNDELEKLKAMASALDGSKPAAEKKNSNADLAALAQQAAALKGDKPESKKPAENKPKGGVDLAALAQQAAALGGSKPQGGKPQQGKPADGKKKGGIDLEALAKQAAELKGGKK